MRVGIEQINSLIARVGIFEKHVVVRNDLVRPYFEDADAAMEEVTAEVDGHPFALASVGCNLVSFTRQELFVLLLGSQHPHANCPEVQYHNKVEVVIFVEEPRKRTLRVISIVFEEKAVVIIPTFFQNSFQFLIIIKRAKSFWNALWLASI
jgi:hypothetical protein